MGEGAAALFRLKGLPRRRGLEFERLALRKDGTEMLLDRQWLLARRPVGHVSLDDFEYREVEMADPELAPGEILLKSKIFRVVPAMRTTMKATSIFGPPMPLGEPVMSSATAEIVRSNNPDYPVGKSIATLMGWRDYMVFNPSRAINPPQFKPDDMSHVDYQCLYGGNTITAWGGMLRAGDPQPGETLVVSGAAGSTGSMAAQFGKIKGCRVIGIAGGKDKCDWLINELKLDAAIDYKSENVEARLRELCPAGVNIFYDNVGGEILDAVIENMAPFGRVILCGQISSYDEGDALAPGPRNMMRVVYFRLKLQGILGFDYYREFDAFKNDVSQWFREGKLIHREEVFEGFDQLPRSFMRLFDGTSMGTMMVTVD